MSLRGGVALLAAGCAVAAGASTPYRKTLRCPPGGQTFTVTRTASMSSWGERLDGKRYTSRVSPAPLDICPNGFIVFDPVDSFTPARLARLAPIVASADYQAKLRAGPSYAALDHLPERSGEGGAERRSMALLSASWQVDGDRAAYERYQRAFAEQARLLIADKGPGWPAYRAATAYLANAYRIVGDFAAAQAVIDGARQGAAQAGWGQRFALLTTLIAARDTAIEPEAALPPMLRAQRAKLEENQP